MRSLSQAALAANSSLTAQIFNDLAEVEPLWRALEAEGAGSPYQRFDWVQAYVKPELNTKF